MESWLVAGAGTVVCGVLIALLVMAVVVSARKERERQQTLGRWAAQHGWHVTHHPKVAWGRRMPGRNRRGVSLALSGRIGGRPVTIAEYSYTQTSTSADNRSQSSTTYRHVLMIARLARPAATVAVFRRGAMSRFGRSLFGDRATAIGYEPFDSAYRVAADDARLVRTVLVPQLVTEHIAGHLPDWSLEGDELLTFRDGRIEDTATILPGFAPLLRVADLIDAYSQR